MLESRLRGDQFKELYRYSMYNMLGRRTRTEDDEFSETEIYLILYHNIKKK